MFFFLSNDSWYCDPIDASLIKIYPDQISISLREFSSTFGRGLPKANAKTCLLDAISWSITAPETMNCLILADAFV